MRFDYREDFRYPDTLNLLEYLAGGRVLDMLILLQPHHMLEVAVEDLHVQHLVALRPDLLQRLDHRLPYKQGREAELLKDLSEVL